MSVHSVLRDMQIKLKVPKSRYNSFGDYNYRSLEDILEAIKKALPKDVDAHVTLDDEMVEVGGFVYVMATAALCVGGERIPVRGWAREEENRKKMHPEQLTGCASSYARKYALNGLFLIDDTQDADADERKSEKSDIYPVDKTGNKVIDKAVGDAMSAINNCLCKESATAVGRHHYKLLKDSGATEEQLSIIQQEVENKQAYLAGKGVPA